MTRDVLNHPEALARCPRCDALRDHPFAVCAACDAAFAAELADVEPPEANEPAPFDWEAWTGRALSLMVGALFWFYLFSDTRHVDNVIARLLR